MFLVWVQHQRLLLSQLDRRMHVVLLHKLPPMQGVIAWTGIIARGFYCVIDISVGGFCCKNWHGCLGLLVNWNKCWGLFLRKLAPMLGVCCINWHWCWELLLLLLTSKLLLHKLAAMPRVISVETGSNAGGCGNYIKAGDYYNYCDGAYFSPTFSSVCLVVRNTAELTFTAYYATTQVKQA